MDRRTFLTALAAIGLVPRRVDAKAPTPTRPVDHTLTGRILRSLQRRRDLGQTSGAICVSVEGFHRIEREHGLEDNLGEIRLRGVPVFRRPPSELQGEDYWILETRPPNRHLGTITG